MANKRVHLTFNVDTNKFVLPAPAEVDPHHMVTVLMDTLRARHGLIPVQGRPDELVSPSTTEGTGPARSVSVSYACRSVRVRLHAGREVIRVEDFPLKLDGASDRLHAMCDTYFGYKGGGSQNAHLRRTPANPHPDETPLLYPAPINDDEDEEREPVISVSVERPRPKGNDLYTPKNDITDRFQQR